MRETHIISILESAPLGSLGESELASIRAHTEMCAECLRAYEAAQLSTLLLRERAAEIIEPSPFFHMKVLAALRERQAANEAASPWRLWKAAGALVSSIAATVAALAIITFLGPATPSTSTQETASAFNSYSAEEVIFDQQELPDEQMSYEQVLATLYESEAETAR